MDIFELERRAQICTDEFGGLIPAAQRYYVTSILHSATRSLLAFENYEQLKSKAIYLNADELIALVQEAITQAGLVSRYFWPMAHERKKRPSFTQLKKKRGEKLCQLFQLDENCALFKAGVNQAGRHFDKRLDQFFLENDAEFFFAGNIIGKHTLADDPTQKIFKLLDTDAECLVLLGEKYFFAAIREELKKIRTAALELEEKGSEVEVFSVSHTSSDQELPI